MDDTDRLDKDAMARTAAGELEAFCEIVRRHQNPLLNFFRRLGASTHRAEDLVQETFLRLYQWRRRYAPTASFRTFLYTLARHAWVDSLRKEKRTVDAVGDDAVDFVRAPRVESADADRRMDVSAALAALSDKLRAVVVLNVYHGLNYREIGEVLDIPEGTVKSRMFAAMRQLRELLGTDRHGEDDHAR